MVAHHPLYHKRILITVLKLSYHSQTNKSILHTFHQPYILPPTLSAHSYANKSMCHSFCLPHIHPLQDNRPIKIPICKITTRATFGSIQLWLVLNLNFPSSSPFFSSQIRSAIVAVIVRSQNQGKKYALITMCVGVGQGYAVIIENVEI